jgi:DNA-directed RNA polymerase specialized sigma24 family protein
MYLSARPSSLPDPEWRDLIPAVYRYHLAWAGDPAAAQRLTAQTLALAGRWRQPADGRPAAWLLGMARTARVFPPKKHTFAEPSPVEQKSPGRPELAIMPQFSTELAQLPGRAAEALALMFFAGLSEAETAVVLGTREDLIQGLIAAGLDGLKRFQGRSELAAAAEISDLAASLSALASQLDPDPNWLDMIQRGQSCRPVAGRSTRWWPGPAGRGLFVWRRFVSLSTWLAPAAALLVIVYLLYTLGAFRPPSPPAVLPQPAATLSTLSTDGMSTGWLVVPARADCQAAQASLSALMGMPAQLYPRVVYSNPRLSSTDPFGKGMGCRIEIIGTGADFKAVDQTLDKVLQVLYAQRYQIQGPFDCENCKQGNTIFNDYLTGQGYTLAQKTGDKVAILSLAWRSSDNADCVAAGLCPAPPPERMQYALRLTLASNAAQAALQPFLDAWAKGDARALDQLTGWLRLPAPRPEDLDRLAGLLRGPADVLRFSALPLENNGYWLRVSIQGTALSKLTLPAKSLPAFQMAVQPGQNGWKVTDISPRNLFPPSLDSVFWATTQGQVMRYALADGMTTALTGPDVYDPADAPRQFYLRDPAQVSPGGGWLSLVQPDTDKLKPATLLVDLDHPGQFERLPFAARLAWRGDGEQIAYFRMDRPRTLYLMQAPFTAGALEIAQFDQDLLSAAWSTDGKQIAVEVVSGATPDATPPYLTRDLDLVRVGDGNVRRLATLVHFYADPTVLDLVWTPDDRQIWFCQRALGVEVDTGQTRLLVAPNEGWAQNFANYLILNQNRPWDTSGVQDPMYRLSSDFRWVAWNPGIAQSQVEMELGIAQSDQMGQSLWTPIHLNYRNLAWTSEAETVIAGGDFNQTGKITRISAQSGQSAEIANGVYWIGESSALNLQSLHPLENQAHLLPAPDLRIPWPCLSMGSDVPCVAAPPGWDTFLEQNGNYLLTGNLGFASSYGYSTLGEGGVQVQISKTNGLYDPTTGQETTLDQLAPLSEKGPAWEIVTIGGQKAIHFFYRESYRSEADMVYVPLPHQWWLEIYIWPAGSYSDPVVQKMLESIQLQARDQTR